MRAFLHTDMRMAGSKLLDTTLGLSYSLSSDAGWLLVNLQANSHVDRLVAVVARTKRLTELDAKRAVYDLLGQLGAFGAVVIDWERSFGLGLRWRARLAWRKRQKSTLAGLARAVWRAYGLLVLAVQAILLSLGMLYGIKLPVGLLLAPLILILSLAVHEAGHIVTSRLHKTPSVLLSCMGYVAMVYRRPSGHVARRIAAAGPLLAMMGCGLVAMFINDTFIVLSSAAAGLAHTLCLLPFTADGRTVWGASR